MLQRPPKTSLVLLTSLLWLCACQTTRTVTLVGMADYHSHALPMFSEGEPGQGGVARALAYLRAARSRPDTVVVSGGDMVNRGVPTWSDVYGCVEWPWFNGVVDVMALGNHDLDYGAESFERCRSSISYPVLSANLMGANGLPYFQVDGRPYLVREVGGVRVGFFAVAGPDMQRLVKPEHLPEGSWWSDATQAARAVVDALRHREHVAAVVLIGHQQREADAELARAVPGIDLILGSHSHEKEPLRRVPGTETYTLAPYQYLTYLSEVRLRFQGERLVGMDGGLVKMDASKPEDPRVAAEVARLQTALEADRPERFVEVGWLAAPLRDEGVTTGETEVGAWATEVWRRAVGAHAFFATASTFRAGLPAGPVVAEVFFGAFPYPNKLVMAKMTGAQLKAWVELSESKRGSDAYSQYSGVRYTVRQGRVEDLRVLSNPAVPGSDFEAVRPERTYRVATTDFQAYVAPGYKESWTRAGSALRTEWDSQSLLAGALGGDSATRAATRR
ncbi:MAG: 5'-nucleotidase C-terminal domain-containing protein [Cystobacter sp.]